VFLVLVLRVQVNITFSHADVESASCYDSSCNAQSADFLTTAAINLNAAHNWTLEGVTISHVGGYGFWSATACSNVLLVCVCVYLLSQNAVIHVEARLRPEWRPHVRLGSWSCADWRRCQRCAA
jgi:hypothetical protein